MKKTTLSLIEITPEKAISVRFNKEVIIDGDIISSRNHRAIFMPHEDIDASIIIINNDLASRRDALVNESDVATIKTTAAQVWNGVEPWVPQKFTEDSV